MGLNQRKLNKRKEVHQKHFNASKMMICAVIIICVEILIYAEWAMLHLGDISAIYVLIGIPASLAPSLMAYFKKSQAENTKDGIIYDLAMKEFEVDDGVDVGEQEEEPADEELPEVETFSLFDEDDEEVEG